MNCKRTENVIEVVEIFRETIASHESVGESFERLNSREKIYLSFGEDRIVRIEEVETCCLPSKIAKECYGKYRIEKNDIIIYTDILYLSI